MRQTPVDNNYELLKTTSYLKALESEQKQAVSGEESTLGKSKCTGCVSCFVFVFVLPEAGHSRVTMGR